MSTRTHLALVLHEPLALVIYPASLPQWSANLRDGLASPLTLVPQASARCELLH